MTDIAYTLLVAALKDRTSKAADLRRYADKFVLFFTWDDEVYTFVIPFESMLGRAVLATW